MNFPTLQELFPNAGFGFSMRLRPEDPAGFFAPSSLPSQILSARAQWIDTNRDRHVGALPDSGSLGGPLAEFANLTIGGGRQCQFAENEMLDLLAQLGKAWEPDFLIVEPDATGRFVLRGGCVCFPSGWALEEKLGLPLEEIHGIVPGLNSALGARINQFLTRLKPGAGWYRSNWGISSSAELNQHPARAVNRLMAETPPESTWLRLEHQLFTRLPATNAILFGIRLENVSLKSIRADQVARSGLRQALATMPEPMARYKNLLAVRPALIRFLA